jgi:predicted nucleic acid-binding protein
VSLVVDASVAFKWFVADEPHAAEAAAVLRQEAVLLAPDILIAEVCNAAGRALRQGRIGSDQAAGIAARLPGLFSSLAGAASLAVRAFEIARVIDHPVYDCLYVALAARQQTKLVTADARLLAKMSGTAWQASAVSLDIYRS